MFNPISLMIGDITKKLLIGGAVAAGAMLLINSNNKPAHSNHSTKGLSGTNLKPQRGKKTGTVKL